MSPLFNVDTSVPPSPHLQGSEHSTLTAHVTEGGLTTSVSTRTTNSGNSSHGSTSTPRLSTVLHTSLSVHGMGLASVFCDVRVHKVDDVGSDRGLKHTGKRHVLVKHLAGVLNVEY